MPEPDHPVPTLQPDDVVITGSGLVTCLGLDRKSTWREVLAGRSGIRPLTAIESTLANNKGGGEAPPLFDVSDNTPREVAYLRLALREALTEADVRPNHPYPPHRCGVVIGTTLHGMRSGGRFLRTGDAGHLRSFLAGDVLASFMDGLDFGGLRTTICSACSSGLGAIALASTLLKTGLLDLVVTGGYDPISEYAYAGFNCMRLVTDGVLQPFSKNRTGMKIGEGYGLLVLERAADAPRRGATPLAVVAGFGESCDAYHLSKPHPDGDGAARAITAALKMAGLPATKVDMIAAHATATPDNDAAEFQALSRVFGDDLRRIPVVAFKSHVAHTLGGAGAVELILSLCALRDQIIPPCANVAPDDAAFDGLQLVTGKARRALLACTLNTSLGFGGSNTCVILRPCAGHAAVVSPLRAVGFSPRDASNSGGVAPTILSANPEHDPTPRGLFLAAGDSERPSKALRPSHRVLITGIGVVLPQALGNEAFVERLSRTDAPSALPHAAHDDELDLDDLFDARRTRRMSNYVKLTLAATTLAYRDAGVTDIESFGQHCYAMLGTTHGSTVFSERYYHQLLEQGVEAANPLLFAEGVPNAAAAHLSTTFSIRGLCQTVVGTRKAGLDALLLAARRIGVGDWDRAVVGAADEHSALVDRAYQHFGLGRSAADAVPARKRSGFVTGWGAVTLILEREDVACARGGRPRGVVETCASGQAGSNDPRGLIRTILRILAELGGPPTIFTSANDTWIGDAERAAIRRWQRRIQSRGNIRDRRTVSTLYCCIPEVFSVHPLASMAGVLLTGVIPTSFQEFASLSGGPRNNESLNHFGVLCTDYSGGVTGVRITLLAPGESEKA